MSGLVDGCMSDMVLVEVRVGRKGGWVGVSGRVQVV